MKIIRPAVLTPVALLLRSVVAVGLTLAAAALAPTLATAKPIPGQYIVTVAKGRDARGVAHAVQARTKHFYDAALNGFAAELNKGQLNALQRNPSVERIEQDAIITPAGAWTQSMDAKGNPWGLDRIDQRALPLSNTYSWLSSDGSGVRAYILDTGLRADHPEFGNRAMNVYNATSGSPDDCVEHGTHVAGIVGAATFGVAKNVRLRGVKVSGGDCTWTGTWSDLIEGVDWVTANHIKPAVANISISGGKSLAANEAVKNLVNAGVFVAVSAGNMHRHSCSESPGSVDSVYTTAASTRWDTHWPDSDYGDCVDGYAPGEYITSTLLNTWGALSGSSQAAPHVAGVAALWCAYDPSNCTPSTLTSRINDWSTKNVITDSPEGTPNRLLYTGGMRGLMF